MGVATATLVKGPCRLCWSIYGTNVPAFAGCGYKVDEFIYIVSSATSQSTIENLRKTFANFELSEMLVTDNRTGFKSRKFANLVKHNSIRHVTLPPYHPSSNGLAERAVQTMKGGLKKLVCGSLETKLARFLFKYRLHPQTVTGVSPAELKFDRPLCSQLDLLQPDIQTS